MRILNRPMFRYGGPIKEGVMHGMRDGGRIGFKDGSKKDTRTSFEKNILNMPPPNMTRKEAEAYLYNYGSLGSAIDSGGQELIGLTNDMLGNYGLNPLLKAGSWITGMGKDWTKNLPSYNTKQGMIDKWSGTIRDDKGKIISTNTKTPTDQVIDATASGKVPGHGDAGMTYTDPDAAAKLAKTQQNERLQKYLDMMGYDRSKKTAMSDALIDASALVQDATTEAGSIKHADWGKLINKAIQTTSRRMDKPEQIREAVGLMSVKAAIQKDLEDPEAKELRRAQIKKIEKELKGNSFAENKIITSKAAPGQAGFDLAVELTEGKDFKGNLVTSTDWTEALEDMKDDPTSEGKNDQQLVELYVNEFIEGKNYEDGHYTVGDNLVTIKDSLVIDVE